MSKILLAVSLVAVLFLSSGCFYAREKAFNKLEGNFSIVRDKVNEISDQKDAVEKLNSDLNKVWQNINESIDKIGVELNSVKTNMTNTTYGNFSLIWGNVSEYNRLVRNFSNNFTYVNEDIKELNDRLDSCNCS